MSKPKRIHSTKTGIASLSPTTNSLITGLSKRATPSNMAKSHSKAIAEPYRSPLVRPIQEYGFGIDKIHKRHWKRRVKPRA